MNIKSTFEKKFKLLYTLGLCLGTPLIIISLIIKNDSISFLLMGLVMLVIVISLLYFSYLSLKFKQTINRNQYFLFILAISIGIYKWKDNILLPVGIVALLSLYGSYKVNLHSKDGKETFAKRVAYLSIASALYLFIMLIRYIRAF